MLKLIIGILLCFPTILLADECLNVSKPKARIIYLHGMDLKKQTINEKKRRVLLKKISQEKSIEIFLPRATMLCPKNKNMLCWMWGSDSVTSLKTKWSNILSRSKKCFKSKLVFLGFSNGGNFLNKI